MMRRSPGRERQHGRLVVAICAALSLLVAHDARAAEDPTEIWPELQFFKNTSPRTRLFFMATYAEGQDSALGTLDLAGFVDITLDPRLRGSLRSDDWTKKKYAWLRIGYDYVFRTEDRELEEVSEERGIIAFHGRTWLPGEIFVEGRLRADLRWIGDDYSTRYRTRLEVNRDFVLRNGRTVTPYLQVETFYDTRYDGWSRALYQVGADVETRWRRLRIEPYIARQVDRLPEDSAVNAFGFVVKRHL
jgi:hypothetical protein